MLRKMRIKKGLFLFGISLAAFVLSGCGPKKAEETDTAFAKPTPVPTRPIEETIGERPYVSLLPTADGHWVTLGVENIPQSVSGIEYELTYLAEIDEGKIERGVSSGSKPVELNGSSEYSKKILFGSASCTTGVCKYKYDENVSEGAFVLTLHPGNEYQAVYRIQKGAEAKEGLTAGDGVFSYTASTLPPRTLYLTTSTIGVPKPLLDGATPKTLPYGIFPSLTGKGTVTFKTSLTEGSIYAYNGKAWQKLATTIEGGVATAQSSGASVFIFAQ